MKKRFTISILWVVVVGILFNACSISYQFTGGSLDYNVYKSISITNFPNNAELVNPTLSQTFSETLKDKYTRQTRLEVLSDEGGQMHIEGEIVGYQLTSMAISADSYASETKITMTVNVRFYDYVNSDEDFERKYTAYQTFDSRQMLSDVEGELVNEMVKEIVDKIFNETVAKW